MTPEQQARARLAELAGQLAADSPGREQMVAEMTALSNQLTLIELRQAGGLDDTAQQAGMALILEAFA